MLPLCPGSEVRRAPLPSGLPLSFPPNYPSRRAPRAAPLRTPSPMLPRAAARFHWPARAGLLSQHPFRRRPRRLRENTTFPIVPRGSCGGPRPIREAAPQGAGRRWGRLFKVAPAAREGDGGAGGLSPLPAGEAPLRAGTDAGKGTSMVVGAVFHGSGVSPLPRDKPPAPRRPIFTPFASGAALIGPCSAFHWPTPLSLRAGTPRLAAAPAAGSDWSVPPCPCGAAGRGGRCKTVGSRVRDRGGFEE